MSRASPPLTVLMMAPTSPSRIQPHRSRASSSAAPVHAVNPMAMTEFVAIVVVMSSPHFLVTPQPQICIGGIFSGSTSFASVAATTCSTETTAPVSMSVARPPGKPITAISITTRSTERALVQDLRLALGSTLHGDDNAFDTSHKVHRPPMPGFSTSAWYILRSDDKRSARLNCIAYILSLIPHKTIRRKKAKLPKRVENKRYADLPSLRGRHFVPERY